MLQIERFSEKAVILTGDTFPVKERIKAAVPNGRTFYHRKARGWVFSAKHVPTLQTALADLLVGRPLGDLHDPQPKPATAGPRILQARTEAGTIVQFGYAVLHALDLIPSHDPQTFDPNPLYPADLQPRERERAAMRMQVQTMAAELDPALLLESPLASMGAPVVFPNAEGRVTVESGNGRAMALQLAYMQGDPAPYRKAVLDFATFQGLPVPPLATDKPALVRIRLTKLDHAARVRFCQESNAAPVSGLSAREQAELDAAIMPSLSGLVLDDDGALNTASNMPFITAFVSDVCTSAERPRMLTADGSLSQDGILRIRNAVFARAYGQGDLMARVMESTDSNVKSITNGLLLAAPVMARLRDSQERGTLYPLSIGQHLAAAVATYSDMRRQRATLETMRAQGSLIQQDWEEPVELLVQVLEDRARSARKVADWLAAYAEIAESYGSPAQAGLIDLAPPCVVDCIEQAQAKTGA